MSHTPTPPRITDYQLELLSKIFRIIVKEIRSESDKEDLAPGELGISYVEKTLYIRNPHTGELFSPNSIEHLSFILKNFNPKTGDLNADTVNYIRFYNDLHQLTPLGVSLTADSIIRQMVYPSFLVSVVEYENYEEMGFPSALGIIKVAKLNESYVVADYTDILSNTMYIGKYNTDTHYLEGWISLSITAGSTVEAEDSGDNIEIHIGQEITDMMVISIRLKEDLLPGATISINELPPVPIINPDGSPLGITIPANNIIMLIRDEQRDSWVLVPSSASSLEVLLEMLKTRINTNDEANEERFATFQTQVNNQIDEFRTDVTKTINEFIESNTNQLTEFKQSIQNDVNNKYKELVARLGNIKTEITSFTPSEDITTVPKPGTFDPKLDIMMIVNYGQTMLRQGIDYTINEDGSLAIINDITIKAGDIVTTVVCKQDPIPA